MTDWTHKSTCEKHIEWIIIEQSMYSQGLGKTAYQVMHGICINIIIIVHKICRLFSNWEENVFLILNTFEN